MKAEQLQAEQELLAEVQHVSEAIADDIRTGRPRISWAERRGEIAALRQRIRTMRDQHLGKPGAFGV